MASKNIAFITGITGQDGAYLAEYLLGKGYEVHGLLRWDAVDTTQKLKKLDVSYSNLTLHHGDMNDAQNIARLIKDINPTEIYNLASLSHVGVSFETPASALDTNAKGTLHVLEAVRLLDMHDKVRIYQASSSEMFGSSPAPQSEDTPFQPCSPYGVAKLAAYWLARTYRDAYGLHVSNGILFNHESPLRGEDFVTRKITRSVAAIEAGQLDVLRLGNLDSVRDWGDARDYIEGMWLMLQQEAPDDYVLASAQARSVREFAEVAFEHIGIELEWRGEGVGEVGVCVESGRRLIQVDEAFFRPKEVHYLLGDASKAKAKLDWAPRISFEEMVADMIAADREGLDGKGEEEVVQWLKAG